jgi:AcrR family transcriptional regulator
MSTPPDRAGQTRARLMEAAREALLDGGGDFELSDLARRAGTSIGLPYHRFGSKSGLIASIVADFYDGIWRAVNLADFGPLDWAERERERLRRLVDYLYGDPLSRLIISTLARDPEVAALEAARWGALIEASGRNLAQAQRRGQIAADIDPALTAAMINGGIRHAIGLGLSSRPRRTREAMVDELWSFVSRVLRLEPASRLVARRGKGAARARRAAGRSGVDARRGSRSTNRTSTEKPR